MGVKRKEREGEKEREKEREKGCLSVERMQLIRLGTGSADS
jgi:hypothetical protein